MPLANPSAEELRKSLFDRAVIRMRSKNLHHLFFFRKDLNRWNYPEPILVLLLFFPSKRELPLTEPERLGIWAARGAREEVKRNIDSTQVGDLDLG